MSIQEMMSEWKVAKVLVTEGCDYNYLLYRLGQYNIYVHKLKPIVTSLTKITSKIPHIIDVKTPDAENVRDFILEEPQFKAYKIFKHGEGMADLGDSIGLAANTIKNALNLFMTPKIFCIDSKDRELRDQFYNMAVRINDDDRLYHEFDFDTYDYKIIIKKYKELCGKYTIVTVLTGDNMPNAWNS